MATNEQKDNVLNELHITLHAIRMNPSYKPTPFEMKVSYLVSSLFQDTCNECKVSLDQKKRQAEEMAKGGNINQSKGLFDKILGK